MNLIWDPNVYWDLAIQIYKHQCTFNLILDQFTHLNLLKKHVGFSLLRKANWEKSFQHFRDCSFDFLHPFEIIHLFFDSPKYFHEQFEFIENQQDLLNYAKDFEEIISMKGSLSSIDYFCEMNQKEILKERCISEFFLFKFIKEQRIQLLKQEISEEIDLKLRTIDTCLLVLFVHFIKKKIYLIQEINDLDKLVTKEQIELDFKKFLTERNFIKEKDLLQIYHYLVNEFSSPTQKDFAYLSYLLWNKGYFEFFNNIPGPLILLYESSAIRMLIELLSQFDENIDVIFKYAQKILNDGKFNVDCLQVSRYFSHKDFCIFKENC
jgi:hypothetical protein